jgi:putative membrane protein
MLISLQTIGSFLLYFGAALALQAAFVVLYMAVTPHHEAQLIKQGNAAAAISLGGAVLGFSLPLASVIAHSVSVIDLAVWGAVALVVQLAVYWLVDFLLREVSKHIDEGNIAAATTLASASLAIGLINAASMTY